MNYEFVDANWCPDCGLPRGVCRCEDTVSMEFQPGQKVFWVRQCWNGTYRIPATVIKINRKTIQICAEHMNGKAKWHNVQSVNLVGRADGESRVSHE